MSIPLDTRISAQIHPTPGFLLPKERGPTSRGATAANDTTAYVARL
jgi:hypothetical protein